MDKLSANQAYTAMLLFLDTYYQQTKSGEIAVLIHEMMFLADGETVDPAAWQDWMKAVQEVQTASQNPEAWEQLWKRLDSRHLDFQ